VLRGLDDLAMMPVSEGWGARTDRHRGRQGLSRPWATSRGRAP